VTRIDIEAVSVRYGSRMILKDVTFTVEDSELCVLVGPSGCGKTTLLQVIAGLTRPAQGRVRFDGQPMDGVPPGDRDIAMCFQTYALYPTMTVRENWVFPLRMERLPESEIRRRIDEIAELLHMGPLLDRYPHQLSGGQQQRVALGRALVRRPRVYLLDEPMGNLDAKLRIELRAHLKRIQKERGITTIYVTHDQADAQALGDRMVVLHEGRIQQIGAPQEIYDRPGNLFVARFVGSPPMNLIPCELAYRNGRPSLLHPAFEIPLPDLFLDAAPPPAGPVILGVRPEALRVCPEDSGIPAEVYVVEPQGDEVILDLRVGDHLLKGRFPQEALGFRPQLNQRLCIAFDPKSLHLFDPQTGLRIV